ncbi:MAG TPA: VWA domain-containing protein [Alphaproteobacteria bacterium]|nr:VWA domain-containing protein [Alphaproteobacteria bacterium]
MNRDDLDTLLQLPHSAGRAFVRRMVGFLRSLRENGFAVGLGEGRDALRIAAALDLSRPRQLRAALKPLLATRREEAQRFDAVFDAYWLRRGVKHVQPASVGAGAKQASRRPMLGPVPERVAALADTVTRATGEEVNAAESEALRRGGASRAESLSRTDFRHLDNPDDLELLDQLVETFAISLRRRLQRRRKAARRGERLDLRRMLHASIAHGGEPIEIYRRHAPRRPLRPVLMLDASGSMSQYSAIFLRFMLALLKRLPEGEGYLFHTRLVEIGPVLRERRRVAALERLSLMAEGWGGGTRIGECLSTFAKHHARRALRGRSILFILSDGYDTGEPELLAKAMTALAKRARRVIWLNPLLGWRGYQPIAGGMAAALPHIDVFAPAHNLESLTALAPQLARA